MNDKREGRTASGMTIGQYTAHFRHWLPSGERSRRSTTCFLHKGPCVPKTGPPGALFSSIGGADIGHDLGAYGRYSDENGNPWYPCGIRAYFFGSAQCDPRDQFRKDTGRKLALARAMQAAEFDRAERTQLWQDYFYQTMSVSEIK